MKTRELDAAFALTDLSVRNDSVALVIGLETANETNGMMRRVSSNHHAAVLAPTPINSSCLLPVVRAPRDQHQGSNSFPIETGAPMVTAGPRSKKHKSVQKSPLSSSLQRKEEGRRTVSTKKNRKKNFVHKLFGVLESGSHADVIRWLPGGAAFVIADKKRFTREILPAYFKQSQFASFTRKMLRWRFKRIPRGSFTGAYYHKFFNRKNSSLCLLMKCNGEEDAGEVTIPPLPSSDNDKKGAFSKDNEGKGLIPPSASASASTLIMPTGSISHQTMLECLPTSVALPPNPADHLATINSAQSPASVVNHHPDLLSFALEDHKNKALQQELTRLQNDLLDNELLGIRLQREQEHLHDMLMVHREMKNEERAHLNPQFHRRQFLLDLANQGTHPLAILHNNEERENLRLGLSARPSMLTTNGMHYLKRRNQTSAECRTLFDGARRSVGARLIATRSERAALHGGNYGVSGQLPSPSIRLNSLMNRRGILNDQSF